MVPFLLSFLMTKSWTEERRQKARERILANKPWEKSTGPKTNAGKKAVSLNAVKHGARSRLFSRYDSLMSSEFLFDEERQMILELFQAENVRLTNKLQEIAMAIIPNLNFCDQQTNKNQNNDHQTNRIENNTNPQEGCREVFVDDLAERE